MVVVLCHSGTVRHKGRRRCVSSRECGTRLPDVLSLTTHSVPHMSFTASPFPHLLCPLLFPGAELFESLLLDHDPGVNSCNWNYFAGIGNDPRNRHFKTVTQVGG